MDNKKIECQRFKTGYIDESGDMGQKGSKCLVLTYICLDERKRITKIINKTKQELKRTKKGERWLNRMGGEIKFSGFPDNHILLKTLEQLTKLKFPIRFIAIYKDNKNINPAEKVQIIFDLIGETFNLCEMPHKIIADKDYFNNKKIAYLAIKDYKEQIYDGEIKGYNYKIFLIDEDKYNKEEDFNLKISIKHENSKTNLGLQIADLMSGAIFQEMEHENKQYTEVLRQNTDIRGRIIKP